MKQNNVFSLNSNKIHLHNSIKKVNHIFQQINIVIFDYDMNRHNIIDDFNYPMLLLPKIS